MLLVKNPALRIQSPTHRNLLITCIWCMEETSRWNCFFRVSNFSCSCFSLSSSCPSSSLCCVDCRSVKNISRGFFFSCCCLSLLKLSNPSPTNFFVKLRTWLRSGYLTVSRRVVEESRSGWDWITWKQSWAHQNSNEMLGCSFQPFPIKGLYLKVFNWKRVIFIESVIQMNPGKEESI